MIYVYEVLTYVRFCCTALDSDLCIQFFLTLYLDWGSGYNNALPDLWNYFPVAY